MARPATTSDLTDQSEDWIEYAQQGTLTANKPTTVIERKVDTGEQYTIERIGTNAGYNVTVGIYNKNDQLGEDINGFLCPIVDGVPQYQLRIPYTFTAGDHIKLVATATSAHYNAKFAIFGHKIDKGL